MKLRRRKGEEEHFKWMKMEIMKPFTMWNLNHYIQKYNITFVQDY